MRSLIVLSLLVLATCGCQDSGKLSKKTEAPSNSSTESATQGAVAVSSSQQRLEHFNQFMSAAQLVCDKTKDKEADHMLAFLKKHSAYSPDLPAEMPSFNKQSLPAFNVYALEPGDQQEWAQSYLSDPYATANFHPAKQSMILRYADQYSPLWLGIMVLHETRHAYTYLAKHPDWAASWAETGNVDLQIFCYDEAETHVFHGRLFREIGGKAYEDLLAEVIPKLEATAPAPLKEVFNQTSQTGVPKEYPNLTFVYPTRAEIEPLKLRLDAIFGPAESEREWFSRISLFAIDVNFVLADKYAKDPLDAKAFYLACQYGKNERQKNSLN